MRLLITRHSLAQDPGTQRSDSDRDLTTAGCDRAVRLAQALESKGFVPDTIYSSPYLRAQKTAELIAQTIKHPDPIVELSELSSGSDLFESLSGICAPQGDSTVMIVGHMPDVGILAQTLLARPAPGFSPATTVCLELSSWARGGGSLLSVFAGDEV